MKYLMSLALLVAVAVFSCKTCQAGRKIRGSGELATEERKINGINGVDLATIGTLYIEVGDEEKLSVEAEDNLLPYIETEVRRGILTIHTESGINLRPREPVSYYLTVKELDEIEVSSCGDIEAPDLKADRFRVTINSSGDLKIGDLDVTSLDVRINSSGDVSSGRVTAKNAEVDISSSGDVYLQELNADLIVVDISSSGNLKIAGGKVDEQDISISSSGDYNAKRLQSNEAIVSISSCGDATVRVDDYLEIDISSSGDVYYVGDPDVHRSISSSGKIRRIRR